MATVYTSEWVGLSFNVVTSCILVAYTLAIQLGLMDNPNTIELIAKKIKNVYQKVGNSEKVDSEDERDLKPEPFTKPDGLSVFYRTAITPSHCCNSRLVSWTLHLFHLGCKSYFR